MMKIMIIKRMFYLACLCYKSGEVPACRKIFSLTALGVSMGKEISFPFQLALL